MRRLPVPPRPVPSAELSRVRPYFQSYNKFRDGTPRRGDDTIAHRGSGAEHSATYHQRSPGDLREPHAVPGPIVSHGPAGVIGDDYAVNVEAAAAVPHRAPSHYAEAAVDAHQMDTYSFDAREDEGAFTSLRSAQPISFGYGGAASGASGSPHHQHQYQQQQQQQQQQYGLEYQLQAQHGYPHQHQQHQHQQQGQYGQFQDAQHITGAEQAAMGVQGFEGAEPLSLGFDGAAPYRGGGGGGGGDYEVEAPHSQAPHGQQWSHRGGRGGRGRGRGRGGRGRGRGGNDGGWAMQREPRGSFERAPPPPNPLVEILKAGETSGASHAPAQGSQGTESHGEGDEGSSMDVMAQRVYSALADDPALRSPTLITAAARALGREHDWEASLALAIGTTSFVRQVDAAAVEDVSAAEAHVATLKASDDQQQVGIDSAQEVVHGLTRQRAQLKEDYAPVMSAAAAAWASAASSLIFHHRGRQKEVRLSHRGIEADAASQDRQARGQTPASSVPVPNDDVLFEQGGEFELPADMLRSPDQQQLMEAASSAQGMTPSCVSLGKSAGDDAMMLRDAATDVGIDLRGRHRTALVRLCSTDGSVSKAVELYEEAVKVSPGGEPHVELSRALFFAFAAAGMWREAFSQLSAVRSSSIDRAIAAAPPSRDVERAVATATIRAYDAGETGLLRDMVEAEEAEDAAALLTAGSEARLPDASVGKDAEIASGAQSEGGVEEGSPKTPRIGVADGADDEFVVPSDERSAEIAEMTEDSDKTILDAAAELLEDALTEDAAFLAAHADRLREAERQARFRGSKYGRREQRQNSEDEGAGMGMGSTHVELTDEQLLRVKADVTKTAHLAADIRAKQRRWRDAIQIAMVTPGEIPRAALQVALDMAVNDAIDAQPSDDCREILDAVDTLLHVKVFGEAPATEEALPQLSSGTPSNKAKSQNALSARNADDDLAAMAAALGARHGAPPPQSQRKSSTVADRRVLWRAPPAVVADIAAAMTHCGEWQQAISTLMTFGPAIPQSMRHNSITHGAPRSRDSQSKRPPPGHDTARATGLAARLVASGIDPKTAVLHCARFERVSQGTLPPAHSQCIKQLIFACEGVFCSDFAAATIPLGALDTTTAGRYLTLLGAENNKAVLAVYKEIADQADAFALSAAKTILGDDGGSAAGQKEEQKDVLRASKDGRAMVQPLNAEPMPALPARPVPPPRVAMDVDGLTAAFTAAVALDQWAVALGAAAQIVGHGEVARATGSAEAAEWAAIAMKQVEPELERLTNRLEQKAGTGGGK